MIDITKAKKIAEKSTYDKLSDVVYDDGEYYIFGYADEIDISPIGVNKNTSEVVVYFPPDHPKSRNAKEIIL